MFQCVRMSLKKQLDASRVLPEALGLEVLGHGWSGELVRWQQLRAGNYEERTELELQMKKRQFPKRRAVVNKETTKALMTTTACKGYIG